MSVIAWLRDGSRIEGVMSAWGSGWAVIDGRRWCGVVSMVVATW